MPDAEPITVTVAGDVGYLLINRPAKRNALSLAMWHAVPGAIAALAHDDAVRVVVVAGAGADFSAGADIAEFTTVYASRDSARRFAAGLAAAMDAVAGCAKPTVAMIRGVCIGSGLGLALCCDRRFAAAGARFGITPAKLGLAYSFEDTRRLVNCTGAAVAKDMLFTARIMDAAEALGVHLVDRLCDPPALEAATLAYAGELSAASQTTIRIAKAFVARAGAGYVGETAATHEAYLAAVEGADFAEGRTAFLEHRPPRFSRL